ADTLHARLVGGADFAELARTQSQDASSQAQGGDLGWFLPEEFGPEFATVLAGLRDGELSRPFQTAAGWHIVKRVDSREADVGDQNRRAQVRDMIGRRKLEDRWERFVREMRSEAFVDLRTASVGEGGPATCDGTAPARPGPGRAGRRRAGAVRPARPTAQPRSPRGAGRSGRDARRSGTPRPAAAPAAPRASPRGVPRRTGTVA